MIYDRLVQYQDEKYREFQSKLVPNIPKETILGVKTPQMRAIAKAVAESHGGTIQASCPSGNSMTITVTL